MKTTYNCPGLEAGFYIKGNSPHRYERYVCAKRIGWWRKNLIGQCAECVEEEYRRGTRD